MILHLDLDAFFVSAHRTVDPSLKNIPVVVGGRSDPFIFDKSFNKTKVSTKNSGAFVQTLFIRDKKIDFDSFFKEKNKIRGIVITASYEARKYGIKTGMSIKEALFLCKNLKVLVPEHTLYHYYSNKLKNFLQKKIPVVEQYSIDEFFADTSGWVEEKDIIYFAKELKDEISKNFDLPISIGIAKTKWIAKFATKFAKPNGIKLILPHQLDYYLKITPIEEFPGIGRAMSKKLKSYKKTNLLEIKNSKQLLYSFGRIGIDIYKRVCGIDEEKVTSSSKRKSIGISRTFDPLLDREELKRRVIILARHLCFIIAKNNYQPSKLYLSLRYEYSKNKKHISFNRVFNEIFFIKEVLKTFYETDIYPYSKVIRISLSLTLKQNKNIQFSLFEYEKDKKNAKLLQNTTKIRQKYGIDIFRVASEI